MLIGYARLVNGYESWTETIDEATGEPTGMTLTLADWLYDGVVERGGVLTIHEDYFLLTGGIERWLYRVVRKHAGSQESGWSFTMRQLYEKSGSAARPSDFAIDIRRVVQANQLPEYELAIRRNEEGEEIVMFVHRKHLPHGHERHEQPRRSDRRRTEGIYAAAWNPNGLPGQDSGDQAQLPSVDSVGRLGAEPSDDQAQPVSGD